MRLPWRNSASEMFVNLNIRSFDEMFGSYNLFITTEPFYPKNNAIIVDSICTNILQVVFIQCFYLFCDHIIWRLY